MLIQCDYGDGEFFVRNQTIYYQGVKISPVNPAPIWSVGEYELYLFPAVFPLKCSWLVVMQSRYPSFYECKKVEFEGDRVMLTLKDGKSISVKPYRDGAQDRFLINPVYTV